MEFSEKSSFVDNQTYLRLRNGFPFKYFLWKTLMFFFGETSMFQCEEEAVANAMKNRFNYLQIKSIIFS